MILFHRSLLYTIRTAQLKAFCERDSTSFNIDGHVISNSAMDIFVSALLSDAFTDGYNCPTKPTPENICQPFRTICLYSCVKTTKIHEPILRVPYRTQSHLWPFLACFKRGLRRSGLRRSGLRRRLKLNMQLKTRSKSFVGYVCYNLIQFKRRQLNFYQYKNYEPKDPLD